MEALAAEATRDIGDATTPEELNQKVEQALACPCLDDLKEGPCGPSFVAAFSCFLKSRANEKGSDCVASFQAMQRCMVKHPQAFAESTLFHADKGLLLPNSANESDAEVYKVAYLCTEFPPGLCS
ncbi:hypothetical protein WJX79_006376 [Trebouxia sp. C0005]